MFPANILSKAINIWGFLLAAGRKQGHLESRQESRSRGGERRIPIGEVAFPGNPFIEIRNKSTGWRLKTPYRHRLPGILAHSAPTGIQSSPLPLYFYSRNHLGFDVIYSPTLVNSYCFISANLTTLLPLSRLVDRIRFSKTMLYNILNSYFFFKYYYFYNCELFKKILKARRN